MKKILLILIIILMTNPAFAWQPDLWTTKDTALESAFIFVDFIDMWQTYTFLYTEKYQDRGFYETNPILGEHPSKRKLLYYTGITIAAHAGIAYILPAKIRTDYFTLYPRNLWQLIWIGIEIKYIYHNYKMGVKINF